MPVAVVYRDRESARSTAIANALTCGLGTRNWEVHDWHGGILRIYVTPDLVAGYGWGPTMRRMAEKHGDRLLTVDLGYWDRKPPGAVLSGYHKLALGSRWPEITPETMPYREAHRLLVHHIAPELSRAPSMARPPRILVCGMSGKAAGTFDLEPEQWEIEQVRALRAAGCHVTYRPKPSWAGARPLRDTNYHDPTLYDLKDALEHVDGVATHHGNCAVDALAAGLPFFVEVGTLRPWSVPTILDLPDADAQPLTVRRAVLRELAWHQWNLEELARGDWLAPGTPIGDRLCA